MLGNLQTLKRGPIPLVDQAQANRHQHCDEQRCDPEARHVLIEGIRLRASSCQAALIPCELAPESPAELKKRWT
jgi:hypothetical protein